MSDEKKIESRNFVQKLDGGKATRTRDLREGQKPSKPANLSRPKGVQVPSVPTNAPKK